MLDEQAAVYREVVAAVGRHYVPHACFDFSAVIDCRGRVERREGGICADKSVILEPLFIYDVTVLGGAGELAHSYRARSEEPVDIAVNRAVSSVCVLLCDAARIGEIIDILERRDILVHRHGVVDIHIVLRTVGKSSVEMRRCGNGEHGNNRTLLGGGVDILEYRLADEIGGRAVMRSGERGYGIYPIALSAREQVGDIVARCLALGLAAGCDKLRQKPDRCAAERGSEEIYLFLGASLVNKWSG